MKNEPKKRNNKESLNLLAIAFPMPPDEPVISAVLPCRLLNAYLPTEVELIVIVAEDVLRV